MFHYLFNLLYTLLFAEFDHSIMRIFIEKYWKT